MTIATCKLPAQTSPGRVTVLAHRGRVEIIDAIVDEWRSLCAGAADDQPFYRPEWIRAHLRAFAPEAQVVIIAARLDGRLCLILPLVEDNCMFSGLPVRRLRSPVNAHVGRFDAVRTSGPDGDEAICATWDFLKELEGWNLLEFPHTPAGSTIERLITGAGESGFRTVQVPEKPNPFVRVPSDPDFLKQMPLNSRLRTKLRQARRELAKRGSLILRRIDAPDRAALDRFYQLESSGWKGREGSGIACSPSTRQFYDEVAESAARFGYFSLYMLELNGQLLAAHFALTSTNRCYSPKVAYQESFRQFAPGHLIVAEMLRDCAMRGIRDFDITGPDDEWKMKWTSETQPSIIILCSGERWETWLTRSASGSGRRLADNSEGLRARDTEDSSPEYGLSRSSHVTCQRSAVPRQGSVGPRRRACDLQGSQCASGELGHRFAPRWAAAWREGGVYLERRIAQVLSIFGVSQAGGVIVPANGVLFPDQVAHIARDCDISALITSAAKLDSLSAILPQISSLRFLVIVSKNKVAQSHLRSTTSRQ